MSIFIEKNGKKVLPASVYIKTLVFFALVGISVLVMQPVQAAVRAAMQEIRSNLIEKLEEASGMQVAYTSLRPSFFGSFDIRNLRFLKNDTPIFTVYRVRLYFSVFELLVYRNPSIHTIHIDRPVIRIDAEKDSDTIELLSSYLQNDRENSSAVDLAQFLPQDANYRIRNLFFYYVDGDTSFQISDMSLNINRTDTDNVNPPLHFDSHLNIEGSTPFLGRIFTARTAIDVNGFCASGLDDISGEIAFSYLSFMEHEASASPRGLFSILPSNYAFSYNHDVISLFKNRRDDQLNLILDYNLKTQNLTADINFNSLKPDDRIILSSQFGNINYLLGLQLTGEIFVDSNLDFVVNLRAVYPGLNTVEEVFLLDVHGGREEITVNNLRFSSYISQTALFYGSMGFSGRVEYEPIRPHGIFYIEDFSLTGKDSINTVFNITNSRSGILVSSPRTNIADSHIGNLEILITPDDREMNFVLRGESNRGGFNIDSIVNLNPASLEAYIALNSISIYEITQLFRPFADFINIPFSSEILRETDLNTEIFLSTDFKNFNFNAPSIAIEYGDNTGMLSAAGTDKQFTLSEGVFTFNGHELLLSADIIYSNPAELAFTANASFIDLSWRIEGQVLDGSTLIARDQNGLHIYGNISNNGAMSGYIEAVEYPFPINYKPVYTNLYATLRYNSHDFWNVDFDRFSARFQNNSGSMESFSFSGIADQDGASFRNIILNDHFGILAGSMDFIWDSNFTYLECLARLTDGHEAGENYILEGSYIDGNTSLHASFTNIILDRFTGNNTSIRLSADVNASWESIESFSADINLLSFSARLQNEPLNASLNMHISHDELTVQNLRLVYSGVQAVVPQLDLNLAHGVMQTSADINGDVFKRYFSSNISLEADFEGIDSWLNIKNVFNRFSGALRIRNVRYGDHEQDHLTFNFSSNEGSVSVSGGIRDMLRIDLDNEGNLFAGLSAPFPIRGSFSGTYINGILNAGTNNVYIDLAALWSLFVSIPDFSIPGGYITGAIDIRGDIINPEFFGNVRGTSIRLSVPGYVSEDIRIVPFNAVLQGYEMTFSNVIAASGSGYATADGWFIFNNWVPLTMGFDINIPRENPIPYGMNIAGFLANGNASGYLYIMVDSINQFMEYNGSLLVNNTELGLNMDVMRAAGGTAPFENMDFNTAANFEITLGPSVEFLWPNVSPVLRANPEMGSVIHVSLDTQSGQYSINSDIRIRAGELYYFDRSFYIRQGNIVFRENESRFDPRISARAELRDRSDSGPVTIAMIINNQPLLNMDYGFEPRFEASPALTQLEIYSILGQNLSSVQGYDNAESAQRFLISSTTDIVTQIAASSDFFSQFVFLRQFERQAREFLRLDMFSLRTRFLQNALISGTSALQTPVDRNNRVGNYFDNTTVSIGRYIGQFMIVQGMLTLKYDESSIVFGGIRFEPDIGIELQSPFVNIRWDFFPSHPENWWVNDNSITLSWSKSF